MASLSAAVPAVAVSQQLSHDIREEDDENEEGVNVRGYKNIGYSYSFGSSQTMKLLIQTSPLTVTPLGREKTEKCHCKRVPLFPTYERSIGNCKTVTLSRVSL